MAKIKKKRGKRPAPPHKQTLIGRSDIPYAKRITMQHRDDIIANRDHSAKIAMFCTAYALNELEGVGYKRLVRFGIRFHENIKDFYEDVDVGMAHAKQRLEQMGMPISGEFYSAKIDGATKRQQDIHDHRLQASQIALICSAVTMNDEFGFGQERQTKISVRVSELTARYAKEGEQFLLDKMAEIGFEVVDGEARAYMDDEDRILTPKQWRKENGNELR